VHVIATAWLPAIFFFFFESFFKILCALVEDNFPIPIHNKGVANVHRDSLHGCQHEHAS